MSWYDINARFRPISNWPGASTEDRQRSRFDSPRSKTLRLLARELDHIVKPGETPVLEMAISESQIRLDGYPYASAKPEHPGVILSIESRWGPLRYPCDTFDDWQDNVRAIALALEALRKVDRYGVTKRGEQYAGWKALPGAGETTATMTTEAAAKIIARTASLNGDWLEQIVASPDDYRTAYLQAVRYSHPDAGGTMASFQRVQTAKRVLDAHHGRTP
jgi:hypothetical protein